jgi:hypothetical protein
MSSSDHNTRADRSRIPPSWIDDAELARMSYYRLLEWCIGRDGKLRRDRLIRVASAKNYSAGWVYYNTGKRFDQVWRGVERWQKEHKRRA